MRLAANLTEHLAIPAHCMRTTRDSLSVACVLLVCAALLSWPAAYNHFPLVFSDTGTYIAAAIEGFVPSDRPVYYSQFLWIIGRSLSLYAVPVVQGLVVMVTLSISITATLGRFRPLIVALVAFALIILTPLAWGTSWLMPMFLRRGNSCRSHFGDLL